MMQTRAEDLQETESTGANGSHSATAFDEEYFLEGPYEEVVLSGWQRYLGKYFWARRFYANLVRKHKREGSLLEIGCGFGDLLRFLESRFETYGIDISAEAIEIARRRTPRSTLQTLAAEDIEDLGRTFDVIVACHVLEHLENPSQVMKSIADRLNTGGLLLMVVPNTASLGRTLKNEEWVGFRDKTHISLLPPEDWLDILEQHDLDPRRQFSDGLWDAPYLPVIPALIQKAIFGFPAMIQVLLGMPFIPLALGESLVVIAVKTPASGGLPPIAST